MSTEQMERIRKLVVKSSSDIKAILDGGYMYETVESVLDYYSATKEELLDALVEILEDTSLTIGLIIDSLNSLSEEVLLSCCSESLEIALRDTIDRVYELNKLHKSRGVKSE